MGSKIWYNVCMRMARFMLAGMVAAATAGALAAVVFSPPTRTASDYPDEEAEAHVALSFATGATAWQRESLPRARLATLFSPSWNLARVVVRGPGASERIAGILGKIGFTVRLR